MAELREVAAILDGGKVDEAALQLALQALLHHQCLYEDWPNAPAYRIISRHLSHIQPIMGAFGYIVTHHPVANMLVLQTNGAAYNLLLTRLRKDETIVLLALRLLYAEGGSSLDESGRVEITTDEVHDRLTSMGDAPPAMPRLQDILKTFHRKGIVRLGERDPAEHLMVLNIMPGITLLVPDTYVERLIQWLETQDPALKTPPGVLTLIDGLASGDEAITMPLSDDEELGMEAPDASA